MELRAYVRAQAEGVHVVAPHDARGVELVEVRLALDRLGEHLVEEHIDAPREAGEEEGGGGCGMGHRATLERERDGDLVRVSVRVRVRGRGRVS